MKVAIVLNTSWNIYNFRLGLVKTLLEQGIEVHTIAPKDDYSKVLEDLGCKHHLVRMDSRGANPIKDFALTIELLSIYKKVRPDLILHFTIKPNIYGTLAAHWLNIPTINNVCGLGTVFLKNGIVSKVAMALYKLAFKYPKKIFFQNSDDQQLFAERKLVNVGITEVIPGSGIDPEYFVPRKKKEADFKFLLISRLIHDKGVAEYVEAARILRNQGINASFQILGSKDPEHKRGIPLHIIDQWIDEGAVEYLGTTRDVRPFIHASDCVVLPSYREGTPRTLLEAASSAKPLVATDVPGCRNIVKDDFNGFLCKMKDAEDLASKMMKMLSISDDRRKLFGKNGRKLVVDNFDQRLVIDRYMDSIEELRSSEAKVYA